MHETPPLADRIAAQLAELRKRRDEVRRQAERDISYLNGAIEALEALGTPPATPPADGEGA